jgi:hypothetical protein
VPADARLVRRLRFARTTIAIAFQRIEMLLIRRSMLASTWLGFGPCPSPSGGGSSIWILVAAGSAYATSNL